MLFELGMMYLVGREVPVDLVSAHKWFNLAAMKGNLEAIRLRREIADQCRTARSPPRSAGARLAQGNRGPGEAGDRGLKPSRLTASAAARASTASEERRLTLRDFGEA